MPSFSEIREEPCPWDGGRVVYQYGNWHCGGYNSGCGWTTARVFSAPYDNPANGGMVTMEHCPKCGGVIIYNGNYFCEHWDGDCDWALPDEPGSKADRAMALRLYGER